MDTWMGDENHTAYRTDKGYLLLEREDDGINYTFLDAKSHLIDSGFAMQPLAKLDAYADYLIEQRDGKVLYREPYFPTMEKIAGNWKFNV